jgi:hypothetical protein
MKGRAPFVAGVLSFTVAVTACQSTPPVPSPGPTGVANVDPAECRRLIESVNVSDDATIRATEACRFNPAGAEAASALLAASTNLDTIWAALWVYSASGSDPAPVRPLAANPDPSVRAMAAATLIAFGDRSGLAAAQDLLTETEPMRGSLPPVAIGNYMVSTLVHYVVAADAPAPGVSTDVASDAQAWAAWLPTHREALQFSPADGVWRMP